MLDEPGDSSTTEPISEFLDALFPGGATGKLIISIGGPPRWRNGKYANGQGWRDHIHEWPADRDAVIEQILAHRDTRDVYLCTGLGYRDRSDGSLKEIWVLHADWDGDPANTQACVERVKTLGGFAINSGTPGHLQCFVPQAAPVITSAELSRLCQAFHAYLPPGTDAAKHKWNDVERIPGTFNHESAVRPNG